MPSKKVRESSSSTAAYTLVDLSALDPKVRKEILNDANAGGGRYGVRVVEESINGGARAPIYGVYKDGPDAENWAKAKDDLGISFSTIDDDEVQPASVDINDPAREAAVREAAAQSVEAQADRIRRGEETAVRAITHDDDDEPAPPSAPPLSHTANIVDDTLAPDATNEAANAENQKPAKVSSTKSSNKAPK